MGRMQPGQRAAAIPHGSESPEEGIQADWELRTERKGCSQATRMQLSGAAWSKGCSPIERMQADGELGAQRKRCGQTIGIVAPRLGCRQAKGMQLIKAQRKGCSQAQGCILIGI